MENLQTYTAQSQRFPQQSLVKVVFMAPKSHLLDYYSIQTM